MEEIDLSDDSNHIIMGDSPLATKIASKPDAVQLTSIVSYTSLDKLSAALDECGDRIKVAFIDYDYRGSQSSSNSS